MSKRYWFMAPIPFSRTGLLAATAVGIVMNLFSPAAVAVYQGVAGEALLVPLAVVDTTRGVNTVINIKVPARIGPATIPNNHTAPHTSPSNVALPSGQQVTLHWYFLDKKGKLLVDSQVHPLPQQLFRFDLNRTLNGLGVLKILNKTPGYLVFTTESGAKGHDADFNMFGEARIYIHKAVGEIPVIAMADGADSPGSGLTPTPGNEVVETGQGAKVLAVSPLSAGMSTAGGLSEVDNTDSTEKFVGFDLNVGAATEQTSAIRNPTLLVIWNDRNNYYWEETPANVYNGNGQKCSSTLDLNNMVNAYWIHSGYGEEWDHADYFGTTQLCDPNYSKAPRYIQFFAPPVSDLSAAALAFSIVFHRGLLGTSSETALASERGLIKIPY